MTSRHRGTVVWYRPAVGRGVLRGDDGRQYFFGAAAVGELELDGGVLVEYELSDGTDGPVEARALRYEGGRRQVKVIVPPTPPRARRKPTRKQSQAARRAAEPPARKKPRGAMPEGRIVNHPDFGTGHVVAATANLVSVEFLSGQRRSVKPSSLTDVGGPDVPKAPTRKRRARKTEATPRPVGRKSIRRKKDGT